MMSDMDLNEAIKWALGALAEQIDEPGEEFEMDSHSKDCAKAHDLLANLLKQRMAGTLTETERERVAQIETDMRAKP